MWQVIIAYLIICLMEAETITPNNTILISKYAKVARWGANENNGNAVIQNRRNNSGQVPWNHRSDSNIIGAQTTNRPRVIYQYPVYKIPAQKVDHSKVEKIPGVGEVIQDRFNARPYFGYGQIPPKQQNSASYAPPVVATVPTSAPVHRISQTVDLFPVPATEKAPVDLYTSQYNSYNPPDKKPDISPDSYPPGPPDSYAAYQPSPGNTGIYADVASLKEPAPSYATLGPPLSQNDDNGDKYHNTLGHGIDAHSSDHVHNDFPNYIQDYGNLAHPPAPPSSDNMVQHNSEDRPKYTGGGPPNRPPKNEDDIYIPSDDDDDNNNNGHAVLMDQPKDTAPMPQADMTMDLSPPASDDHSAHFPHYLYDNPHYDHHIYEEVPHTTTTEATEDKRLSSTNYSYYYLGRKLWYIPLYFSIYFMFYVAALILKSIARHKIQYQNNWVPQNSRSAREMTLDENNSINDVHTNITTALSKTSRLYSNNTM